MSKVNLFDLEFSNFDFNDLSKYIDNTIKNKKPKYLVTCNVDHIVKLTKDEHFQKVYNSADSIVADGVPIVWASKILRKPLKEKISGSDIIPKLATEFERKEYKLFFLGAGEGIALSAKKKLNKKFPSLNVVGCYSPPYGFENNLEENSKIISLIKSKKPDILFVGLGAPKQEKWIYKNYKEYEVPISIGVGATFDFLSGNIKRAPLLLQKVGLEWFWRVLSEPKRLWKRYLIDDSKFIILLVREVYSSLKKKFFSSNEF